MSERNFHDLLAELCFKHFRALPKKGKPKDIEWTILSCVVLEKFSKYEIVASGTGTKCIGQDKMSVDGDIVNDSHAEVICRRAFMRFIYDELIGQKNEIFTFNTEEQNFKLNAGIKFHFFSTQVPCGDAAIFPKQDVQDFGDCVQNSLKRPCDLPSNLQTKKLKLDSNDIFRTGAKCLPSDVNQDPKTQGIAFHVTGVVRTKPGRGTPTLSVSCSDKISRWCHLGVQGALLSILLKDPIYFSSFTVSGSTPYSEDAMRRAFFQRVGKVQLEPPFQQCDLIVGQAALVFEHGRGEEKKPCHSSIIWSKGTGVGRPTEVAVDGRRQGVTQKKLKTAGALQICKRELFKKFIEVVKLFNLKMDADNIEELTYKEVKMYAKNYQKSWSTLKEHFKAWTAKDQKLLNFRVALKMY